MSEQEVEINDPEYYMSEPKRQIGCSIANKADYENVLAALQEYGIDVESLKALHGQDGADIMDMLGENHGLFANIRRIFPTINNDIMENMSEVEKVLKADGYALGVPAAEHDEARRIAKVLLDNNATNVLYFGRNKMWRFSKRT